MLTYVPTYVHMRAQVQEDAQKAADDEIEKALSDAKVCLLSVCLCLRACR